MNRDFLAFGLPQTPECLLPQSNLARRKNALPIDQGQGCQDFAAPAIDPDFAQGLKLLWRIAIPFAAQEGGILRVCINRY